jgi:hypothetical protein
MRGHGILLLLLSIRLLPGLQLGGYLCEAGCTRWGMPDSLVNGTIGYYPNPRIFGNRLVGVGSIGAPLRVFRFTFQGFMNQSIVGLLPLSETAYSTGHDIP